MIIQNVHYLKRFRFNSDAITVLHNYFMTSRALYINEIGLAGPGKVLHSDEEL
jgi:hypothetical protein